MISVKRDTWSLWKAHELEVANQASEARALAPKTHLDGLIPSALESPTVRTLVAFSAADCNMVSQSKVEIIAYGFPIKG